MTAIISLSAVSGFSQQEKRIILFEDSLRLIAKDIMNAKDEFVRFNSSKHFSEMLQQTLQLPGSFVYPFDSLVSISKLTPPDKRFRIFTWGIPKEDGTYDFAGLIQMRQGKEDTYSLVSLTDNSSEIQHPENQLLNPDQWFGALYYKVIQQPCRGRNIYTLLGWDASSPFSRSKLIEILTIKDNGQVVFGAEIFSKYPKKVKRVILEYSSNVSITLNYSEQLRKERIRKKKKTIVKSIPAEMIVFDRLMPMTPELEGQYRFYVPETNVFDGFVFENNKWQFIRDIDARNPTLNLKKEKADQMELDLFPGKEKKK